MKSWFKMLGFFLLIVLVLGGIYGFNLYKLIEGFKNTKPPVPTVSTTTVNKTNWPIEIKTVGSLRSEKGIELTAEVGGIVEKIFFSSGSYVKEGDTILQLRADEDRARLNTLRATAKLAQAAYSRDLQQYRIKAVSRAQLDSAKANRDISLSQVSEQEAFLNKKIIKAPFTGKLGIIKPEVGQLLPTASIIASLNASDFLFVDFYLPQNQISRIKIGQKVKISTDVHPEKTFDGKVFAIDSQLDSNTRNLLVRAKIDNQAGLLFSGMFAEVALILNQEHQTLIIPQAAVTFSPYGESVFVITTAAKIYDQEIAKLKSVGASEEEINSVAKPEDDEALAVEEMYINTGAKRGDQIEVIKGLNEGQELVTSGQIKIKNGALIQINNQIQPLNEADPQLIDR